jgi:hypothetical protein
MSAWRQIAVNGALADSLVWDFGGVLANNTVLPPDSRLCVTLDYKSAAATQLYLFLATGAGVAAELQDTVYDSAFQTNPGADQTTTLKDWAFQVPILAGVPLGLRITKAATNANIWIATTVLMGPGC